MGDMARWLKVSLPFVSAVENGKKKIPNNWYQKIVDHYHLDNETSKELKRSIEEAQSMLKLNLQFANDTQMGDAYHHESGESRRPTPGENKLIQKVLAFWAEKGGRLC